MKKQILIYGLLYGLCGGLLIAALKLIEYRFIVLEHSIEIYGGLIALLFAAMSDDALITSRNVHYSVCMPIRVSNSSN